MTTLTRALRKAANVFCQEDQSDDRRGRDLCFPHVGAGHPEGCAEENPRELYFDAAIGANVAGQVGSVLAGES